MTHSGPGRSVTDARSSHAQPFPAPTRTPRLLLRGSGIASGEADGAWWPWTANLTAELHDLISALTPRVGPIARIGFDWNATSLTQRRIDHDDGVELRGPGIDQLPDLMRLTATDGGALILRVIPFDTPPREADERMRLAISPSGE